MRPAGKTWGMALLFALGSLAKADPPAPYETTITVPEVEVRAGPSPQFYATMKLRQGERVQVVEQRDGGWLAVEPPPGSFNWINERFIERATPNEQHGDSGQRKPDPDPYRQRSLAGPSQTPWGSRCPEARRS